MTAITGFLIALAIGMTGIGGGILTAPVLLLFLGLPAIEAVGTALVFCTVVKLLAAPQYLKRGLVNWRALRLLLVGGLPGVLLGAWALNRLDRREWEGVVLTLVGLTVVASAALELFRRWKKLAPPSDWKSGRRLGWVGFPIGLEVGFSSAGAGALGSLALLAWSPLLASEVVGTDLIFGLALSLGGSSVHYSLGAVRPDVLWVMLAGGVPGALLGSHLAHLVPGRLMRLGLTVWLLWLGSQLLLRGIAMLAAGR